MFSEKERKSHEDDELSKIETHRKRNRMLKREQHKQMGGHRNP